MANYNNFSGNLNNSNMTANSAAIANNLNTINPQSMVSPQQMIPMQNTQQLFLQSQGNLYMINNPLEISNVPVGTGLSAAISLSEGLMYLKSMQNGIPMVIGYKLSPIENISTQNNQENLKEEKVINKQASEILEQYDKRLQKIEQFLSSHASNNNNNNNNSNNKEGEKLQWQI